MLSEFASPGETNATGRNKKGLLPGQTNNSLQLIRCVSYNLTNEVEIKWKRGFLQGSYFVSSFFGRRSYNSLQLIRCVSYKLTNEVEIEWKKVSYKGLLFSGSVSTAACTDIFYSGFF